MHWFIASTFARSGRPIKSLLPFGFALPLSAGLALAEVSSGLPSFGESILEEQFPPYAEEQDSERELRRYRAQLETFRQDTLEAYNRAVQRFRTELVAADGRLEIDRAEGRVSTPDYEQRHEYLALELEKSEGMGEYMKPYFLYLRKYRTEVKWVSEEIERLEKEKFKF